MNTNSNSIVSKANAPNAISYDGKFETKEQTQASREANATVIRALDLGSNGGRVWENEEVFGNKFNRPPLESTEITTSTTTAISTSTSITTNLLVNSVCSCVNYSPSGQNQCCNVCHHQEMPAKSKAEHNQTTSLSPIQSNCSTCRAQLALESFENQQDIHSNSFMFLKFLSNLPKSITQRSKSSSSSILEPEVAGYMAKRQRCNRNESSNIESANLNPTGNNTMTATDYNEDQRRTRVANIKTIQTGESRQQFEQDSPKLIKIITPTPEASPIREQRDTIKHPSNSTTKLQNSIKLSIATTATTTTGSSVSSLSSCILSDSSSSEVRLKWGKKMDFLLSIIGFAVDLANIWRFPYLVYKNGGGVFLIPYVTMLIFGGIPLFFLELCLGQFVKKGPITVWNKICPSMKGVGYCSILISWYVSFYYNVLIAWSVYFIYRSLSSFGQKMPWEDCDNSWNSKGTCVSISQLKSLCSTRNETLESCRKDMFAAVNVTSPASEFFVKELSQIDQSTGLNDMGYLRPELVFCTIIVYLLHYFSLFRGLETSGKVVWVTATAPYMILSILLVRGLFLPGASMGIEYYLSPKLEKLADPQVWIDAAGQVFYSIGVGFGVHLTYASFNSHNNNCYRDCLTTSAVNAATSVYSGLVVFVYLGYMAKNLGIEIDKVASEGYSLVFEVYPEALTTLPFARFWSILFFIMLLTLGIDSAVSTNLTGYPIC